MPFVQYQCADVANCGRPFMAYDGIDVSCPYCGEVACPG